MSCSIRIVMASPSTMRRLSDEDVRAIFESLHGTHLPPPHLKFHIVPVGADGLKLSPPSYEFEGKPATMVKFWNAFDVFHRFLL